MAGQGASYARQLQYYRLVFVGRPALQESPETAA